MNRKELEQEYNKINNEIHKLIDEMNNVHEDKQSEICETIDKLLDKRCEINAKIEALEDDYDITFYTEHANDDWRDWSTNRDIIMAMTRSVRRYNKDKLMKYFNKVLADYEESEDHFAYEIRDLAERLLIILEYIYDEHNSYDYVFALDTLENDGYWQPYKEPFSAAVDRLVSISKIEYK